MLLQKNSSKSPESPILKEEVLLYSSGDAAFQDDQAIFVWHCYKFCEAADFSTGCRCISSLLTKVDPPRHDQNICRSTLLCSIQLCLMSTSSSNFFSWKQNEIQVNIKQTCFSTTFPICDSAWENQTVFFHFLRKLGFSRTDKYKKRRIEHRKQNCIISNRCDFISTWQIWF